MKSSYLIIYTLLIAVLFGTVKLFQQQKEIGQYKLELSNTGRSIDSLLVDSRGLVSVVYHQGTEEYAFDYMTPAEFQKEFGVKLEYTTDLCVCHEKEPVYETDAVFRTGDILWPNIVHQDTLVVLDGELLTKAINSPTISSDQDIADVLDRYTKKYRH